MFPRPQASLGTGLGAGRTGTLRDKNSWQVIHLRMHAIQVIDDPAAATVATRVGLARQMANYRLHAVEAHGWVRLAEERKWGGRTERLLIATAASSVVSPSAQSPVAVDPDGQVDRLSASHLIALGARIIRKVGGLVRRATGTGKRLATLAVDTEGRFRSAADRAAFSAELTEAIATVVAKWSSQSLVDSSPRRLVGGFELLWAQAPEVAVVPD